MKTSCQIAILVLAALVAATPYDCPPAATVTVIRQNRKSVSASRAVPVTSAFGAGSTATVESLNKYMTISVTNLYGSQMSLSLALNSGCPSPVGNPSPTVLPDAASTYYTFPTRWAGRISVGPNLDPDGSKIESSYTGPPDIDVSYVDGYSVPITCSSEGTAVSGCNIKLFTQPGILCKNLIDGPVCRNPAQNIADGPSPPFFAGCAGAAYTYPHDNDANVSNLNSTLISCCIGTSCNAPSRQPTQNYTLKGERIKIRDVKPHLLERRASPPLLLPLAPRLRHRHYPPRSRIPDRSRVRRFHGANLS